MSTRERAIDALRELPEDASWPDIEERIHLQRFLALCAALLTGSCSCAIYGGETYHSSDPSQRIAPSLMEKFANEAQFRRTSETDYKRGRVYLDFNESDGDFRIQGSYCGLPWEMAATSPAEVSSQVSRAEGEAVQWFRKQGIRLQIVPTDEIIKRSQIGEPNVGIDAE